MELSFAELNAGVLECIDELEQLSLPAHQLRAGLSAASIRFGQLLNGLEVLWVRRDVLRWSLPAIGEDAAFVEFAASAMAGGFAALPSQGVERAGQERLPSEAVFEQTRQELLGLEKLGPEGTETGEIHEESRGGVL
ncbi:MAG TPA: hypothetical protein VHU79_02720 [Sphingomicrobium sp.]|nr:hypothetical protein [Sphingomicrobium sp.]